jgi:hypothetical protein
VYEGGGENFESVDLMPVPSEMQGEASMAVAEILAVAESIHGGGASSVDAAGEGCNSEDMKGECVEESAQSMAKPDPNVPSWSKR